MIAQNQLWPEKRREMCESNSSAETKVREEGGARGAPEILPQPWGSPGSRDLPTALQEPPAQQGMPKGGRDLREAPAGAVPEALSPGKGPSLEQLGQSCSPWEGLLVEKSLEKCLPWKAGTPGQSRARTATALAEQWQKQPVLSCPGPPFSSPCATGGRKESPGRREGWWGRCF